MTSAPQLTILAVDDDPDDAAFLRESIAAADFDVRLLQLDNGRDLLAYLSGDPIFDVGANPDIIFLDLNMPGISGYQVLEQIHANPELKRIPIIVVTEVKTESILDRVRKLDAASVVSKEVFFKSCERIVGGLIEKVTQSKRDSAHRRRHAATLGRMDALVLTSDPVAFERFRNLFAGQSTDIQFSRWRDGSNLVDNLKQRVGSKRVPVVVIDLDVMGDKLVTGFLNALRTEPELRGTVTVAVSSKSDPEIFASVRPYALQGYFHIDDIKADPDEFFTVLAHHIRVATS